MLIDKNSVTRTVSSASWTKARTEEMEMRDTQGPRLHFQKVRVGLLALRHTQVHLFLF